MTVTGGSRWCGIILMQRELFMVKQTVCVLECGREYVRPDRLWSRVQTKNPPRGGNP